MNKNLWGSIGVSCSWVALCLTGCTGSLNRASAPPLAKADMLAATGNSEAAIASYDAYIGEHRTSSDPVTQDRVAAARIRKGYALAKQDNFPAARTALLEAEREYRGTGKMVPDEGGAKDEAAYQAAVCLLAMNKPVEGKRALIQFIDTYPDSPKTGGAYKRLMRLSQGKERDAITAKLDAITKARTDRYFLEIAKCGPRAIAYLAQLKQLKVPTEDQLVQACKTDKAGSSMAGMISGLKLCGLRGNGYELNRKDFAKIPTPAIWLQGDHYYVVLKVLGNKVEVYDPLAKDEVFLTVPAIDDTAFTASVLTLTPISISAG